MNLRSAQEAGRRGRLYPSVILHGGSGEDRQAAAVDLARTLLCTAEPAARPCGCCRHCRRILWPAAAGAGAGQAEALFHPDFHVLERDLRASTSVEATRQLMRAAQVSPFEARGQVFVVASAESLTGEAANALLKSLEEPHVSAPRHFLLLAPSRLDLLPTLRSRSLAVFLGPAAALDDERIAAASRAFATAAGTYTGTGAGLYLLRAAEALAAAGGAWDDPRAGRPWAAAAAAVLRSLPPAVPGAARPDAARGPRLALAEALLTGPAMRLRGIAAERILEGLVARHLAASARAAAPPPARAARGGGSAAAGRPGNRPAGSLDAAAGTSV
jgi:hypothetical protein